MFVRAILTEEQQRNGFRAFVIWSRVGAATSTYLAIYVGSLYIEISYQRTMDAHKHYIYYRSLNDTFI